MAKIKLLRFEIIACIGESKKLMDHLQRVGATQIEKTQNDSLSCFDTGDTVLLYEQKLSAAQRAYAAVEETCSIKRSFIQSFADYTEMDYAQYKDVVSFADETENVCGEILKASDEISELKAEIVRRQTLCEYYRPWIELDIPMSSTGTASSAIFIGSYKSLETVDSIKAMIAETEPELEGCEVEVIGSSKVQTCVVVICHKKDSQMLERALSKTGFVKPENPAKMPPKKAIEKFEKEIEFLESKIDKLKNEISKHGDQYDNIKYYIDHCTVQIDKYNAIAMTGATRNTIFIEGYVPERLSEELKFTVEKDFTAQMELFEPDYENADVPVLIKNSAFAAGVENISEMYSPPSNDDVDPNPVMSFFYYALFGLMLSDAGYGLLMVIFGLVAKYKVKVRGGTRKFADFAFFCGLSTMIWGALFGSWFGDLIPTVCTTFFGMENPPNLVLWFDPKDNSMKMLLFSFLFGIIHIFVGLAVRFYNLCKHHDIVGAFCDTVPVYVFVTGFAIIGKNFIDPVSESVKSLGSKLLLAGAILIILTAGRSAKNILGKLGGGVYGLYNTTTGYMGDILSYSRLLALNLVTGVISMVVNLLAAMPKNIFIFIVIFLIGHAINLAINLIGTYVHTNRLQYVEFFAKFYEGGGRSFTPFKLNTKYIKFKEESIYD